MPRSTTPRDHLESLQHQTIQEQGRESDLYPVLRAQVRDAVVKTLAKLQVTVESYKIVARPQADQVQALRALGGISVLIDAEIAKLPVQGDRDPVVEALKADAQAGTLRVEIQQELGAFVVQDTRKTLSFKLNGFQHTDLRGAPRLTKEAAEKLIGDSAAWKVVRLADILSCLGHDCYA